MEAKTLLMLEEKSRFVRRMETLLAFDEDRNDVDSLHYRVNFHDDICYDEYIDIIWKNGETKTLLVTANSNGANLKAVAAAIY